MLKMQAVIDAATELANAGEQPNSLMFALWIAQCSSNAPVQANGRVARALAPFVTDGLPAREELTGILRTCRVFFTGRTLDCLYAVEKLQASRALWWFERGNPEPQTPDEWQKWRANLWALLHGGGATGFGYKHVSFAALLLWPLTCDLAVVDTHVCRRLKLSQSGMSKWAKYERAELMVRAERARMHMEKRPLGLFHWLLWERDRIKRVSTQWNARALVSVDVCESHAPLSPRAYGPGYSVRPYAHSLWDHQPLFVPDVTNDDERVQVYA